MFFSKTRKQTFNVYAAYSFGVPMLIVAFAAFMDNSELIPQRFKPGFGVQSCLISSKYIQLISSIN